MGWFPTTIGVVPAVAMLTPEVLRGGSPFLLDVELQREDLSIHFDALQCVQGGPALGDFHYVPMLFRGDRRLQAADKLLLEILGLLLAEVQGATPQYGLVF